MLIALFFPPSRASGVYRPLAMANYFAQQGWRVTVITVTTEFFDDVTGSHDETLLGHIDPAVRVERVRPHAQHLISDVRRMRFLRAHLPRLYQLRAALLRRWSFPDRYNSWIPGVTRRALRVHFRHRIGVTLATGNPWSAFCAARRIQRLLGVPYVMDYRDSWTLNQFTEGEAFTVESRQGGWERRLIAGASRVVFVNEPMRDWHARRYADASDKMLVVQNGYDPEFLPPLGFRVPQQGSPLRFGYVGTITGQLPHAETWQGWQAARAEPELRGATVHLFGHLGFFPKDHGYIRDLLPDEATSGVRWEGPVGKAEVARAYAGLDIVLMMIPSSRYVTAGKSYECMATGKPIVSVHSPETAASDPLRGYPLWYPVARLDAPSVRDALIAAARGARAMTREDHEACLEHARHYRRDVQLAALHSELQAVIDA